MVFAVLRIMNFGHSLLAHRLFAFNSSLDRCLAKRIRDMDALAIDQIGEGVCVCKIGSGCGEVLYFVIDSRD